MSIPLLTIDLRSEQDVVTTRQRARQIADLLGFDPQDQTRIATAVSEIARNAYGYAGGGRTEFVWDGAGPSLEIGVSDRGPGIANLAAVLSGEYRSRTGLGMGILGARRLADRFDIESKPGVGTTVRFAKKIARRRPGQAAPDPSRIAQLLTEQSPESAIQEVQRQNKEILLALQALQARESDLVELNRELEETNRGVVALYAELDEKAAALQTASELKSRFLTNMSHEFRTPVSSILSLTQLLLDHADGPLTPEQRKQVEFVRRSAQSLLDLVSDLLDLAKIEAGKVDIRVTEFSLGNVFAALRGMFKPLLPSRAVGLIFNDADGVWLQTDEGKVAQILRNLISNAVKFTPAGEVRVCAMTSARSVTVSVRDSGIGIPAGDLDRIFEEFQQIRGKWQEGISGTGLGLPLSRRLAEALGGSLTVESAPGAGSTFTLSLPCRPCEKTTVTGADRTADTPDQKAAHV